MKRLVLILTVLFISNTTFSQKIDVNNIEILRDSFGVPHIYAKTRVGTKNGLIYQMRFQLYYQKFYVVTMKRCS